MRPLQLTMNAFGPYRNKIELDFTEFGPSSIFLVSGPTGSGKTMIFDGLTYALYNATSGETRETGMLKSQYANDQDLCYVELTFEMGESKYRVYRIPQQTGPGQRVKTKQWSSEVEFYKDDQLVSTGREANADIETLMGLSVDQFRQIVMLPQGEFRQLLLSKSNEKEEIFRNIFGTENIQAFQEHLREKRYKLRVAYKDYGSKLDQLLSSITSEKETPLADAVERKDSEQVIHILAESITASKKELTLARQEKKSLAKKEKENEALLDLLNEQENLLKNKTELADLLPQISELEAQLKVHIQALEVQAEQDKWTEMTLLKEKTEKELTNSQADLEKITAQKEALILKDEASKQEVAQLKHLRKEIQHLEKEREKFTELERVEKSLVQQNNWLADAIKQEKRLGTLEETHAKAIKKLEADLANIQKWREELKDVEAQLTKHQQQLMSASQLQAALDKMVKLQTDLAGLLEENEYATEGAKASESAYETARKHYFGNLAGVLAADLEKNEPCPVCGSEHHPNKANDQLNAVSEEELTAQEKQRDIDKNIELKIAARVESKAQAIKEQQKIIGFTADDYTKHLKEIERTLLELEKKSEHLTADKKKLEENLSEETIWRQTLAKTQDDRQEVLLQFTQERNKKEAIAEKMAELSSDMKQLEEALHFDSAADVQAEIDQQQEKMTQIEKEALVIQDELTEAKTSQAALEATIQALKNQLISNKENLKEQRTHVEDLLEMYTLEEHVQHHILAKETEEEYSTTIKHYDEDLSFNKRRLTKVSEELDTRDDKRSLQEIAEDLEQVQADMVNVEQEIETYIAELSKNESSLKGIKKNFEESKKIAKPLAIYEELTEIASGSTRTGYISFERYVLSIYFEEVLYAANKRFENMTNHQYKMIRRKDRMKGAGSEGLDIDVFDRYTGHTRSVTTLSGGETFKASLALALGLSDVIQSQQGGVHVDTLFIDEGFGTLDTDSLEMAIETLMDLQSTGRLIGIISHVEELKERVPTRIVVEKQQEGSQARIEVL